MIEPGLGLAGRVGVMFGDVGFGDVGFGDVCCLSFGVVSPVVSDTLGLSAGVGFALRSLLFLLKVAPSSVATS